MSGDPAGEPRRKPLRIIVTGALILLQIAAAGAAVYFLQMLLSGNEWQWAQPRYRWLVARAVPYAAAVFFAEFVIMLPADLALLRQTPPPGRRTTIALLASWAVAVLCTLSVIGVAHWRIG